jgi:hypothetical protein
LDLRSRHHKITDADVTDSHEVLVLTGMTPTTHADDRR